MAHVVANFQVSSRCRSSRNSFHLADPNIASCFSSRLPTR
jgi:hypothetical protein